MYRLVNIAYHNRVGPALWLENDRMVPIASAPEGADGLMRMIEDWEHWAPRLGEIADTAQGGFSLEEVRLLAPLQYPGKMLFAGANYRDHLAEMAGSADLSGKVPYLFMKPTRHCIIGPNEAIETLPGQTEVDWEVELAVVIGKTAERVTEEEALDYVAGYVVVNDVTERDWTIRHDTVFQHDWLQGKGLRTFCPMGPAILPSAFVPDVGHLALGLRVNGVEKQNSSTSQLVHDVPRLIAFASRCIPLDPGDVISTGTPAGVGKGRGEFLHPGDRVEAWVEGIGTLSNPVR